MYFERIEEVSHLKKRETVVVGIIMDNWVVQRVHNAIQKIKR